MNRVDEGPRLAVFRPDDQRILDAVSYLESRGCTPIADPLLEIVPTDASPRSDAEYVIITSKTGVDRLVTVGWDQQDAILCAIGEATATALQSAGYSVDIVPAEYTSTGLVQTLDGSIDGKRVEVARSDHGSDRLLDGMIDAGGYVHETVLYRLDRPADAGVSTEAAADGTLDGVLFTSSLTVEHFLAAARERDIEGAVRSNLADIVVGAIGPPTAETAADHGITIDVVPDDARFEPLADAVIAAIEGTR